MTFPINAPSAYPVFYRTYSRQTPSGRESWEEVCKRTLDGLVKLGNLTEEEAALIDEGQRSLKSLSSGRWLWVGGTPWIEQPENYYGGYNCSVSNVVDWRSFGLMMDLAMCGCGTGAVLEPRYIDQLPVIVNEMVVAVVGEIGTNPERCPDTIVTVDGHDVNIQVGDSRKGWVDSYQALLELSSRPVFNGEVFVSIDLSHVRPAGEKLQGFGGTSNPIKLPDLFGKCARILNKAVGRKLTAVECCLLIDEAALVVVAGNVRRSAGIRQFSPEDTEAATIKLGLWQQDESGQWRIDPERDALRMANHTRVFHTKPSKETILESVQQQYYSGEGAIEYAPAALVRANADVWELAPVGAHRNFLKRLFEKVYVEKGREEAKDVIRRQLIASGLPVDEAELDHRMQRYGLNPCYAPGTLIHTKDGDIPIEELVGKTVDVFDGMGWVTVDNFRITGHNQQIIKITLFNGASVRVTPGHTFYLNKELGAHLEKVEAHQLSVGDPLICWQGDPLGFTVSKIESDGYEENVYCCTVPGTHKVSLANGLIAGNCGEIVFSDNFCNLAEIHLNQIDPSDTESLDNAFRAAGLVVAVLLNHRFVEPRYQQSREWDPIVGVSFTGLFDFFVALFGVDWLKWWEEGRPLTAKGMFFKERERDYLSHWRDVVRDAVWDYCDRHNLKRPNRYTTAQPAGCLTADAVRVFDQGLLFADEHLEEASGDVDLDEFGLSVRKGIPVRSGIANEKMDLLKVTLANGRQITMTPNHRLSVTGQWTRADQLEIGQNLDFEIGQYWNADEALLDYVGVQMGLTGRQPRGCLLPPKMSPSLAYFIGAMFGNGSFCESHYRIRFTHGNISILEKLSEIGFALFGVKGVFLQDKVNRYELCFANKQLYLWFLENGIHKPVKSKELDRIPQKLRMSSRDSILAFFAGLIDTDGCIRKEGTMSIDSASEAFIRHLQQIGECVGLCFSIYHNTQGQNLQEQKSIFGLTLSRMLSLPESISALNHYSFKAKTRKITPSQRFFKFNPYRIETIEKVEGFSYDYAVDGLDDDDSWYWQGAIKSHNTKSLLTGASPGWHPPKAQRFIRRITFGKNDPVALACLDYGYNIVPSQSDTDENGNLLNDPFDPRCTEWLVEIPTAVPWADIPGADTVDISKFSALAQFDFYMQVQQYYVTQNTSATIEFREHEIEPLALAIHKAIENGDGYVSAALLARFDDVQTFPRLPFEPIDKATYDRLSAEVLERRTVDSFEEALRKHDQGIVGAAGPAGCDSDKCLIGSVRPVLE